MARRTSRLAGLTLGLALAGLVALPLAAGLASAGEGRIYDILMRLRESRPSGRVRLVCLDEKTFSALGGRNPTRAEIASAVDNIWQAGASLIGLDLIFDQHRDEAGDDALQKALASVDAVLACSPSNGLMPIRRFRSQAVGLGSVDFLTDRDGIVRSLPGPYFQSDGKSLAVRYMPMALECALLYWYPRRPPPLRLSGNTLKIGDHDFSMAGHAWLIPFCGGDGTLPRLSFVTALKGGAALKTLKGTIVLVGSTRPIQHDFFSVPLPRRRTRSGTFEELGSNTMAGIEIHGQALSALLEKRSIVPVGPSMRWFLFGLLALLGTTLTIFPMKPVASLGLWLLLGVTIGAGGIVAMLHGRPLPLLGLSLTWLAYAGTSFSYHRYLDFRERKAVEKLFSRYVSPNIARVLLARPDLVHLGGRRKVLSILFADIRGFTSLSERLPPEVVSALLNEYFTEMTDVLFEFDGTLDKFIGDAVLAFFGDPVDQEDHPARAMACAVAMQKRAAALRDRFESDGKPAIHVGIAVHTGPVVVGNNGSADNFDYTVIGDAVNLASRLQALATADDVITTIRTIENIYEFKTRYAYEEMPPVQVRGKSEPIAIARVLGTVQ